MTRIPRSLRMFSLVLLGMMVLWPYSAYANTVAIATLDWTGLTVSLSGNLSLNLFHGYASASSS